MSVTKHKPPCAWTLGSYECGHEYHEHQEPEDFSEGTVVWHESSCQAKKPHPATTTLPVERCPCPGYQRPGSIPKRRKHGINKRAKAFEREVMDELRGVRLGGPGEPDGVTYDNEGLEMLSVECEESARAKSPKWQRDKVKQSITHAKRRRGHPIPIFVSNEKAGRGIQTQTEVHMTLSHFVTLLERLGAFGE